MKPPHSLFTHSLILHCFKLLSSCFTKISLFMWFSLQSHATLGLYSAASVALLTHKCTVILLHQPLGSEIILFGPFLFAFDLSTLLLIHYAMASGRFWWLVGSILCLVIVFCSATFVSIALETSASANWGRSVEVSTRNCREFSDSDTFKLEPLRKFHDGGRRKYVRGVNGIFRDGLLGDASSSILQRQVQIHTGFWRPNRRGHSSTDTTCSNYSIPISEVRQYGISSSFSLPCSR